MFIKHSDYYEEVSPGNDRWVGDPPDEDDFNSDDFKKYCILELHTAGIFKCNRAIHDIKRDLAEREIKYTKGMEGWFKIYAPKLYAAWFVDNLTISPNPTNFERVLRTLQMDIESSAPKEKRRLV